MQGLRIAAAFTLAALVGCGLGDKPVEICQGIVRSGAIDPAGVRWNHVEKTMGALSSADLESAWLKKFDGELPPSTRELLGLYRESPSQLSKTFVELDYTAQGAIGLGRDRALCVYYTYGDRTELISVTLGGQDYSPRELFGKLPAYKVPPGLNPAFFVLE